MQRAEKREGFSWSLRIRAWKLYLFTLDDIFWFNSRLFWINQKFICDNTKYSLERTQFLKIFRSFYFQTCTIVCLLPKCGDLGLFLGHVEFGPLGTSGQRVLHYNATYLTSPIIKRLWINHHPITGINFVLRQSMLSKFWMISIFMKIS